ncbi:hypothetical protein NL676_015030 [Syzygium grande]|nr:hypothetical protein NL676_015030 [Syzygium grande]
MRMTKINLKNDASLLLIAIFILSASLGTCYGREGKHWRPSEAHPLQKGQGHRGGHRHHHLLPKVMGDRYTVPQETMTSLVGSSGSTTTFNVLDYGAKGDGQADDTKLDGKIIAPTSSQAWGSGLLQWIEFTKLTKIKIKGQGIIDGQGSVWWNDSPTVNPTEELDSVSSTALNSTNSSNDTISTNLSNMPSTKPTALRFYGSTDVTVNGITIQNSPQTHLKFDSCTDVQVFGVTISSPGNSPNTDGIHLQNSQNMLIYSTDIASGDDCVSIQTGCSNVYIHNVNCGPGHGISIGGLGKDNTKACVSNVTVRDTTFTGTLTGVRIKTWQGGSGSVQDIMFSNIQVSEVQTPIMIDQFYCDKGTCKNETAAVAVSGINYMNIKGTYTVQAVHFACSDSLPCIGVSLTTIELKSVQGSHLYDPFCWETYGELKTTTEPPISCLQKGKPSNLPSKLVSC